MTLEGENVTVTSLFIGQHWFYKEKTAMLWLCSSNVIVKCDCDKHQKQLNLGLVNPQNPVTEISTIALLKILHWVKSTNSAVNQQSGESKKTEVHLQARTLNCKEAANFSSNPVNILMRFDFFSVRYWGLGDAQTLPEQLDVLLKKAGSGLVSCSLTQLLQTQDVML